MKKVFDLNMPKDMIFKVLKNSDEVIKSGVNINLVEADFFESRDEVPDPK